VIPSSASALGLRSAAPTTRLVATTLAVPLIDCSCAFFNHVLPAGLCGVRELETPRGCGGGGGGGAGGEVPRCTPILRCCEHANRIARFRCNPI
jgi:hypothetical protein